MESRGNSFTTCVFARVKFVWAFFVVVASENSRRSVALFFHFTFLAIFKRATFYRSNGRNCGVDASFVAAKVGQFSRRRLFSFLIVRPILPDAFDGHDECATLYVNK